MISARHGAWILAAALLPLSPASVPSAQETPAEPLPLRVGFGATSFLNVNVADARAAFKAFTKSLGRKKGYDLDVTVDTFESNEEFQDAVSSGSLQLVIMPAWEYLAADLSPYLEPRFLAIDSGYGPREYLLLTRDDSDYRGLRDLRGKHLLLLENTNCEMSRYWMRTILLQEQIGPEDAFFSKMEAVTKPTRAILPVFFGQADACVVSRPIFETLCELNPQLGRRLRSIAVSEPLVDAVTFVAYEGWADPRHRSDLIESLETLHQDQQGMQILTLFKADRLAPFEDRFMDGTRTLKAEHDRLLAEMEGK